MYYEIRMKIGDRTIEAYKIKANSEAEAIKICKDKYPVEYFIFNKEKKDFT